MKNIFPITKMVGLTHQEMASLLQISRSQWSMHELNKRSLPSSAADMLNELVTYVKESQQMRGVVDKAAAVALQAHVAFLLDENKYRRAVTAKNIASVEQKLFIGQNRKPIIALLKQREDKTIHAHELLRLLKQKVVGSPEIRLFELQLKLQLLVAEQTLLEKRAQELKAHLTGEK